MRLCSDEFFVLRTSDSLDPSILRNWRRGKSRRWVFACLITSSVFSLIYFSLQHLLFRPDISFFGGVFGSAFAIIVLRACLVSKYTCHECGSRLFWYSSRLSSDDRNILELSKDNLSFSSRKEYFRAMECRECKTFCFLQTLNGYES